MIGSITTHIEDAFKRLLEQYKDADNIKAIIEIYAEKVQEFEQVIQDLANNRLNISRAVGVQLDEIGSIVNEPRLGKNDEDYRKSIGIRIGINTSEGVIEDVSTTFKLLTESVIVHVINIGDAEMEIEGTSEFLTQDDVNAIFYNMDQVRSGGTRINEIRCFDEEFAFGFSGPGPASEGFTDGEFSTPYRFALPFAFSSADGDSDDPSTEGFGAGHADPIIGGEFLNQ